MHLPVVALVAAYWYREITMGIIKTNAELNIIAGSTFSSTSVGSTTVNSGTGALGISTDVAATTLSIGTGAASKTITLGNITGSTAVNMNIGTGDFTMASANGTLISQLDTGEMTRPLQPAFLGAFSLTTSANAITGAGTNFTLGSVTALVEIFDQGSDFTTAGVFTAPVTGRYLLTGYVRINNITAAMTRMQASITTSNNIFGVYDKLYTTNPLTLATLNGTIICDMDAADTATFNIILSGGAGDTANLSFSATARVAAFSGCLLV